MNDNVMCGCLLVEDPAMAPENKFTLLFYTQDKKTVLQVQIKTSAFVAEPLDDNYLRVYDKDNSCWSVRFSDTAMQEHACRTIAYCRAYLESVQNSTKTTVTGFDLNLSKTKSKVGWVGEEERNGNCA